MTAPPLLLRWILWEEAPMDFTSEKYPGCNYSRSGTRIFLFLFFLCGEPRGGERDYNILSMSLCY